METGSVRDGHGDLRLDQIYFDEQGRASILDCIEFNDRFRFGDVASDIAFLAMDLENRNRRDLAEYFLAAYARAAGDFDLYLLVDFYESYRAVVRVKVAEIRGAREEAEAYFRTAQHCLRRTPATPWLVAVGGGIGTGKSTLANRLGEEFARPVIDTDRTRKQMAGLSPSRPGTEAPWSGLYDKAHTDRVYGEALRRAGAVLASGRTVVVDATFRSRRHRLAAKKTAADHGARFLFVECRSDPEVCRERLRQRAQGPGWSDGREEILEDFMRKWEPAEELGSGEHVVVDTAAPIDLPSWWKRWGRPDSGL
jgi:predicted kinase